MGPDNGSGAGGVASETGELFGEAAAEDPNADVVGEADAKGLGDASGVGDAEGFGDTEYFGDAEGLGKGLGDGETFWAPVLRTDAANSL